MELYLSETYNWVPKGLLFFLLFYVVRYLAKKIHDEIMTSLGALKNDLMSIDKLINNKFEVFDSKVNEINGKLHTVISAEQHSKDLNRVNDEMRQLRDMIIRLEAR